jgi:hypothetical protein
MTFLEPLLLWGLPLIAAPIIIHLLNRMRHKVKNWAAMEFLFMAKKSSTKISQLKHLFILLCRCLVVLLLFLALARPLSGNFFNWSLKSPDTVFLLIDRSASMNAVTLGAEKTRLQKGIENIVSAAASIPGNPQFIVIDSTTNKARTLNDIKQLEDELLFGATETASDILAMMDSTLKYTLDNKSSNSEVWLVSDMQSSDWNPTSKNWQKLMLQFKGVDQEISFKVLSLTGETDENAVIILHEKNRRAMMGSSELQLVFEIRKTDTESREISVNFEINGTSSVKSFTVEGQSLTVQYSIALDKKLNSQSIYGSLSIPDDGNKSDNKVYFAFDKLSELKTLVASSQSRNLEFLKIASAPAPEVFHQKSLVLNKKLDRDVLKGVTLLIVENVDLTKEDDKLLQTFMEEGGSVLFFASGKEQKLAGTINIQNVTESKKGKPYVIARWQEQSGPLSRSNSGISLPLNKLEISKRQIAVEKGSVLASYNDGSSFLSRYNVGKGLLYYCSTTINSKWSNLVNGGVLVPMLHRLQVEGSRRLSTVEETICGDVKTIGEAKSISSTQSNAFNVYHPGVFKSSAGLITVNRPSTEDLKGSMTEENVKEIFGAVALNLQEAVQHEDDKFKTELWVPFLALLFLFFLIESWLTKRQKPFSQEDLQEVTL